MTVISEVSESEKKEILLQTERLLTSPFFKGSSRYPAFLRFVVDQTLAGKAETLKERTLGIEVFGRDPDYDTSGDSIVRVTAGEVRRRIAQYYQANVEGNELRIDLQPGSYIPHFQRKYTPPVPQDADLQTIPEEQIPPKRAAKSVSLRYLISGIAIGLILSASAILIYHFWIARNESLLARLGDKSAVVSICLGTITNVPASPPNAVNEPRGTLIISNTLLPYGDAIALAQLEQALAHRNLKYRVRGASVTSLDDLRSGPAVMIGGLDNDWAMRITQNLRFRFLRTGPQYGQIVDSKDKSNVHWIIDYGVPYSNVTFDYAIVALVDDVTLGQPVAVAAGLGPNGTKTAGEFLASSSSIAKLRQMAPTGWKGREFEAVLATQVVGGNSGEPQILSAEFW